MVKKVRPIPCEGSMNSISTSSQVYYGSDYPYGDPSVYKDNGDAYRRALTGIQVTESVSNPQWKHRNKRVPFVDVGGDFYTFKSSAHPLNGRVYLKRKRVRGGFPSTLETITYDGPMLAVMPGTWMMEVPDVETSLDVLNELGATAISRCSPANPAADLSTFLAELIREGIPSILGATLKKWQSLGSKARRKAIGHEYLNYEFGYKPIVRDLQEMAAAVVDADEILRQYERDSGRLIRRRYSFPPVEETTSEVIAHDMFAFIIGSPSGLLLPPPWEGKVVRTRVVSKRQWFSGGFTYYIPKRDGSLETDMARAVIQAKKVIGLKVTPGLLWNVAPWSWAIDWFSNVGEVLNSVDNWIFDGLVLRYGYMMEHTIVTDTYTLIGPTGYLPASQLPVDVVVSFETKRRIRSTPFGFGINVADFTPRQLAIIASLGLSKS